jgi:hypothetical protein
MASTAYVGAWLKNDPSAVLATPWPDAVLIPQGHNEIRGLAASRVKSVGPDRPNGSLDGPVAPQSGRVSVTIQYVDRQLVVPGAPRQLEDAN